MPADGLEAQDVVPQRCGCWVARMAIFVAVIGFGAKHTRSRGRIKILVIDRLSFEKISDELPSIELAARPRSNRAWRADIIDFRIERGRIHTLCDKQKSHSEP